MNKEIVVMQRGIREVKENHVKEEHSAGFLNVLAKRQIQFEGTPKGKFLIAVGKKPGSENVMLERMDIPKYEREDYLKNLETNGFIDAEEEGGELHVAEIHWGKIREMLEEKLTNHPLVHLIGAHEGMSYEQLEAVHRSTGLNLTDLNELCEAELLIAGKPFLGKTRNYYFTSDYLVENGEERVKKMATAIKKTEREFSSDIIFNEEQSGKKTPNKAELKRNVVAILKEKGEVKQEDLFAELNKGMKVSKVFLARVIDSLARDDLARIRRDEEGTDRKKVSVIEWKGKKENE